MPFISFKRSVTILVAILCLFFLVSFIYSDCVDDPSQDQTCDRRSAPNAEPISSSLSTAEKSDSHEINVVITFVNAESNINLQSKFGVTVGSLFQYSSRPLALYIIGDDVSQDIAVGILEKRVEDNTKYRLIRLNVIELADKVGEIIGPMQEHFSYKKGAYYNHVLFFLSIVLHRVMPESIHRVIMLDSDLKFAADIAKLYQHFDLFSNDNIMALANDAQPVYRHVFHQYRSRHPGTLVGDPPPNGLTGFNSGVVLLDLDRMRRSVLYNSLLTESSVHSLCDEFLFKGHLGDQDFFSLLGMRYSQLFYVLPCNWNRQLCQWWRDHGYKDVFDQYFRCEGDVMIYHGNCNTPIPQ